MEHISLTTVLNIISLILIIIVVVRNFKLKKEIKDKDYVLEFKEKSIKTQINKLDSYSNTIKDQEDHIDNYSNTIKEQEDHIDRLNYTTKTLNSNIEHKNTEIANLKTLLKEQTDFLALLDNSSLVALSDANVPYFTFEVKKENGIIISRRENKQVKKEEGRLAFYSDGKFYTYNIDADGNNLIVEELKLDKSS